ncbi:hypothetical protein GCM10010507_21730 [Streptomyces cinnamoneus]|uniref:Collagen-like protein n=2 Tax=Streptomyces cinnamoneus TaxID=53446 RepID=A0A918TER7_STRCJ|nr:hypothetical protein GCM10010507_21730 [Streptomyces cinnamoneus]
MGETSCLWHGPVVRAGMTKRIAAAAVLTAAALLLPAGAASAVSAPGVLASQLLGPGPDEGSAGQEGQGGMEGHEGQGGPYGQAGQAGGPLAPVIGLLTEVTNLLPH